MYFTIITAGGTGQRMDSVSPKQFIIIGQKPVIVHTIEKFLEFDPGMKIFLPLPEEYFKDWEIIKKEFLRNTNIELVQGGKTRFDSIKNALKAIPNGNGVVAIHDAVRPFVPVRLIRDCFAKAKEFGSGIAAIGLRDSIREIDQLKTYTRDRSKYRLVQTPQVFDLIKIKSAYSEVSSQNFTDDAGVWENAGHEAHLVEGARMNIKITFPEDLIFAEAILKI